MARCSPVLLLTVLLFAAAFGAGAVVKGSYEACRTTSCSDHGPNISYPFYLSGHDMCGYPGFEITCDGNATTRFGGYVLGNISYVNQSLLVINEDAIDKFCLPNGSKPTFDIFGGNTVFQRRTNDSICFSYNCTNSGLDLPKSFKDCQSKDSYVTIVSPGHSPDKSPLQCQGYGFARVDLREGDRIDSLELQDYKRLLQDGFTLNWSLPTLQSCNKCQRNGGRCGRSEGGDFVCFCPTTSHGNCRHGRLERFKIVLGSGIGGLVVVICLIACSIYCKKQYASKRSSSGRSSDVEDRCVYFGVPIFTSGELEEATDSFSPSNELGDGGFGTVYYGKLRDGREVAVKRLFEHNNRRVKHFMNEVEILTRLRHKNLVTLYGCTSSRSHELLLVYEYIANGTVASHLCGEKSMVGQPLPWHIRMSIALQTATALTFLHASDIVHRDVKTNNILLDRNFDVKVADFGISRLFPTDVSHVSTTPQGTPGYVDPEYYQCYQLTEKSDVYSFGVVLIELVSSKPAVDLCRDKNEINLGSFAINRIERNALHELIDPTLGSDSDPKISRTITSVAELAFRCLQPEKEWRPTMDEVLMELKAISGGEKNSNKATNIHDYAWIAKSMRPMGSPVSVMQKWASRSNSSASLPADTRVVHRSHPQHSA